MKNLLALLLLIVLLLFPTLGIHAQGTTPDTPQSISTSTLIFGVAAILFVVYAIVDRIQHRKEKESLAQAFNQAITDISNTDKVIGPLQELAKELSTQVVSAELFSRSLDTVDKLAALLKVFTPDDVDQAIDSTVATIHKVADPPLPKSELAELKQQ